MKLDMEKVKVHLQIWDQMGEPVLNQAVDKVRKYVGSKVERKVRDQAWVQVGNRVLRQLPPNKERGV